MSSLTLRTVFTASMAIARLHAQTLSELKQFSANSLTANPWSTMVEVQPGLFYGTTSATSSQGGGSLFSITSSGGFTDLHNFAIARADRPMGQLIHASDGMLYGTTFGQGINQPGPGVPAPASVLFRGDLKGNATTLIDFTAFNAGAVASPPTAGADGAIYGMVGLFNLPSATGIVYRYTLDGTFTVLHTFSVVRNYLPPLVQANDGNLYGVVSLGATSLYEEIFRISPGGAYTPLIEHAFDEGGTLLGIGLDDKLYGVDGFAVNDAGEAFRLNLDGSGYQVLEKFGSQGGCISEFTGLTLASDGSLYGGCAGGFANNAGGVFRLAPQGTYQQVYSFTSSDGSSPSSLSSLAVQGTDGVFYGEFFSGGVSDQANYNGAIYALNLNLPKPLPRLAALTPGAGSPGTAVLMYGSGFLGATAVSFNGVLAEFNIPSGTYIQATVPAGAATGPITITTPNGTTTSRGSFTVR